MLRKTRTGLFNNIQWIHICMDNSSLLNPRWVCPRAQVNYSTVTAKKSFLKTIQNLHGRVHYKWNVRYVWAHLFKEHNGPIKMQSSLDFKLLLLSEMLVWCASWQGWHAKWLDSRNDGFVGQQKNFWCAGVVSNSRCLRATKQNAFLQVNDSILNGTRWSNLG